MYEELVQAVTEQVLAALTQKTALQDARDEGKEKCLILGDIEAVPQCLTSNMVLLKTEDYTANQNILRYKRVIISRLSMVQLADIAQGRPTDSLCCAVCQALLQGVEVLLLEDALPHRIYAGKGSTAFYRLLEGYVNTLQVFGIKLVARESLLSAQPAETEKKYACYEWKGNRLITEEMALRIAKEVKELVLPADTLLTPSAKDVLKEANIKITRR